MADIASSATSVANNPHSRSVPVEAPILVDGLVDHYLVSPSAQVSILRVIDETKLFAEAVALAKESGGTPES